MEEHLKMQKHIFNLIVRKNFAYLHGHEGQDLGVQGADEGHEGHEDAHEGHEDHEDDHEGHEDHEDAHEGRVDRVVVVEVPFLLDTDTKNKVEISLPESQYTISIYLILPVDKRKANKSMWLSTRKLNDE